jgi:hypothetical protein
MIYEHIGGSRRKEEEGIDMASCIHALAYISRYVTYFHKYIIMGSMSNGYKIH